MTKNEYGHEQGCDCAVCDDVAFRHSLQKGFMSIAEVHEHEKLLREELDVALGKIARLQVDLHQTVVPHDKYKEALKKIARGVLEPGHVYEQAVMMQDIAIKVLQEEHGCTVMGEKVCFACGECDPVTNAFTECVNGLIRVINRCGRGYSFEALRAKILFSAGAHKVVRPKFQRRCTDSYERFTTFSYGLPTSEQPETKNYGIDVSTLERLIDAGKF